MAREKKPVHKVQMTDGKGTLSSSSFRSMTSSPQRIFKMLSRICLAAQSKK